MLHIRRTGEAKCQEILNGFLHCSEYWLAPNIMATCAKCRQSRKGYPPWWSDEDKKAADKVNYEILPTYYQAKVEADEHLEAMTKKRMDSGDREFQAINLRPGTLTDSPGTGKVVLGQTSSRGSKWCLSIPPCLAIV